MHADDTQPARPGHWRILLHDEPDVGAHLDLLIWPVEPRPDPSRPLACFRLPAETRPLPHEETCPGFVGEPIADHRGRYLTYEGELTRGRGRVSEECSGEGADLRATAEGLELTVAGVRYVGSVGEGGRVRFLRAGHSGA